MLTIFLLMNITLVSTVAALIDLMSMLKFLTPGVMYLV